MLSPKNHTCTVCGKVGVWSPSWSWRWILKGRGYTKYEEMVKVCSDECMKKWEQKKVKRGRQYEP